MMNYITDFMLHDFTSYTLCLFIVILLITRYVMKVSKLPPGPYGLPFIGYAVFFDTHYRAEHLNRLCQRYRTKILSMTMFGNTVVFLNDLQLIRDSFQKRNDLVDRLEHDFFHLFDKDYVGVVSGSGQSWKELRRFALYMLRDMGMGKIAAESIIQHETLTVMETFKSYQGQQFNPQIPVNMAVSNIINSLVFGHRFDYGDEKFEQALNNINGLVRGFSKPGLFYLLLNRFGRMLVSKKFNELKGHFDGFSKFVISEIEEHKKKFKGEVTDLIDGYLKEMESKPEKFDEKMLKGLITDLFIAGSETTFTTLRWALLYMAHYPDVQEKVHDELKTVLDDRLPNMVDKLNTPYTEATLSEIQRMNTLVPFGLGHSCLSHEVNIEGYTLPKGTPVLGNLHQVHRDPTIWKNPEQFDPDNFLDNDGKLMNQENLVPFSVGRRSCAGEALAKMELYIFFASWLQRFKIEPDTKLDNLHGNVHGVYQPVPFKIRMTER